MVDQVLIFVIQIAILIFVLSILIGQRIFRDLKALNFIILIYFFTLLRSVADALTWDGGGPWQVENEYHFIFQLIANLFIYYYFEYIYTESKNNIRLVLILIPSIWFILTYFRLLVAEAPITGNPEYWTDIFVNMSDTIPFYTFSLDLQTLLIWAFAAFVSINLVQKSSHPQIRRDSLLLLVTTSVALLTSTLEFSEYFTGVEIDSNLLFIIPFLTMTILYINNPYFSYSSPHEILAFQVVNRKSKVSQFVYQKQVGEDVSRYQSFTSFVDTYIQSVHSNTINNGEFKFNKTEMNDTVTQILETTSHCIFLFAESSSNAIKDGMLGFAKEFNQLVGDTDILTIKERRIIHLLRSYLPFIDLNKVSTNLSTH